MDGVGKAYTVVVPGGVDVVAAVATVDEVVVGGGVEHDVEPVTGDVEGVVVAHKNEARVGVNDHIQDQAGDSVPLPGSELAVVFSHPGSGDLGQGSVEEAEGRVHYIHSVEGRNAVGASEGEGKYSDAHTIHTSEH